MVPDEIDGQIAAHIQIVMRESHARGGSTPPRIGLRLGARLDDTTIDVHQDIPLGEDTPTTIEHVQALACDVFMTLLTRLIESYYRAQAYRLSADIHEDEGQA